MSFQWPKLEQLEQDNKVVLDYDPKYRISIHDSIPIWEKKLISHQRNSNQFFALEVGESDSLSLGCGL